MYTISPSHVSFMTLIMFWHISGNQHNVIPQRKRQGNMMELQESDGNNWKKIGDGILSSALHMVN